MKKGINMGLFEIAVDIGSCNICMGLIGTEKIISEPAVVAVAVDSDKIVETGAAALALCETKKQSYKAVYPISGGLIADKRCAVKLINGICRRLS